MLRNGTSAVVLVRSNMKCVARTVHFVPAKQSAIGRVTEFPSRETE